jgi:hypothetical protein
MFMTTAISIRNQEDIMIVQLLVELGMRPRIKNSTHKASNNGHYHESSVFDSLVEELHFHFAHKIDQPI